MTNQFNGTSLSADLFVNLRQFFGVFAGLAEAGALVVADEAHNIFTQKRVIYRGDEFFGRLRASLLHASAAKQFEQALIPDGGGLSWGRGRPAREQERLERSPKGARVEQQQQSDYRQKQ